MNNIIAVVGVTSGLLTIIGFFIPINSIRARWLHAAYILVVALVVSFATYQSTKLARINDVSRAADRLVAGPPLSAARASDDFESGTLASWGTEVNGAGGWFVYTNGKTAPEPAQSDINVPFDVPNPPQGKFAAVTDMNGHGRRILYRDVILDGRYRLHLTVFYVNAGCFSALQTDGTIENNQQYRIDLVAPSAPLTSLAKDHLLANIFHAAPGDPSRLEPKIVTFDLSPWQGQIVRLRLTEADKQGPLRAGVDDIRFERIEQ